MKRTFLKAERQRVENERRGAGMGGEIIPESNKINTQEWNDELVAEFARIYRRGLRMFNDCVTIEEKLKAFKRENNIR